jgi:hypothetical protein
MKIGTTIDRKCTYTLKILKASSYKWQQWRKNSGIVYLVPLVCDKVTSVVSQPLFYLVTLDLGQYKALVCISHL